MAQSIFVCAALPLTAALAIGGCRAEVARQSEPAAAAQPAITEAPLAKAASDTTLPWGPCPTPFPAGCEIAPLHGAPAKPNADIFLRVPAGFAIPAHFHSSAERMILITGRLEVKYRGSPAAMLEPGSYAYGPARLPHKATCLAAQACTLFIAFEGPIDAEPFNGPLD